MKIKLLKAFNIVKGFMVTNSPVILAVVSAIGVIISVLIAIKQISKARRRLDEAYYEYGDDIRTSDKVKAVIIPMLPVIISIVLTIASILTGTFISNKRLSGAIQAANIAQASLQSLEQKVQTELGDKAAEKIHDAVTRDKIEKAEEKERDANEKKTGERIISDIVLRDDQSLFFDELSGRKFASSMVEIQKAENEINASMIEQLQWGCGGWYSLNDAYAILGIEEISLGNCMGWDIEHTGIVHILTNPIIIDGRPYISIKFDRTPDARYYGRNEYYSR